MLALALAGCQKKEPVAAAPQAPAAPKALTFEAVKETERSKSFQAVHKQLDLGGTLYGYVDIDGDVTRLAGELQGLVGQMAKANPQVAPFAKQDFAELARILGLTDVKAIGVSSVAEESGYYRNRTFLYTGGERHGLMAAMGGKVGPFKHVRLAPADASFFGETEMDVGVAYRTLKDVVTKVAGEPIGNQLEASLKKAGEAATLSFLDLIYGLKGRSAVVIRLHPERTMKVPGKVPFVMPTISMLACVEGIAPVVEKSLAESRMFRRTESGALHIYEAAQRTPLEGIEPVLIVDGSTLYFATSLAFFKECTEQKTGLAQDPEFQRALARVGQEGNGLTYVSPRFFERLRDLAKLNADLPADANSTLSFVLAQVPNATQPLISVRTNLEDGILVRSYWNQSLKADMVAASMYNPVGIGLVAAMAIPAFEKVRTASQEKAVLNNLRMLSAAADQEYLRTGWKTTSYTQLVGPQKTIKVLQPVAGENYRAIRFVQGEPLRVRLANGKVVEYKP